jgi:D-arginine dehydrogenase
MTDVAIIGAGIAGASLAAELSARHRVALIEAEAQPGYHTTGRSAAIWIPNLGPPAVRALTAESQNFFLEHGFGTPRDIVYLDDDSNAFDALLADGLEEISLSSIPALRRNCAPRAARLRTAFDIDVAAVHGHYLRRLKTNGGSLLTRHRAGALERRGSAWRIETNGGPVDAAILVNAAGAWADEIAILAGIEPIGLIPMRRTALIIDAGAITADWPMLKPATQSWYARPEARTKLLVSPADETPTHAHDVQPEEIDIATAIDRVTQFLDIEITRVEHAWAGLRTFAPDRNLVLRWGDAAHTFFWCAGQGGYGIQTAPAAAAFAAAQIRNL